MSASTTNDEDLFGRSVAASPDALMQQLPDDELIFLNLRTESYFALESTGACMYRALIESPTIEKAHERLTSEFDAAPEQLRNDLLVLVHRLVDQGLLELSG
ncbi:MAG: PqqD family protein [Chloroflexi bacterium]|nr:PqqD family protein [Chloroflexota bacterium]